ncbi:MAG: hemerythrin domain-containing protein [Magnetococcales bacterium]|nr:hemerythrin domain-containing protein [Magnetococcales bacterium]
MTDPLVTDWTIVDVGVERFNNDHQRLLFYVIELDRLSQRFQQREPFEDEWDQVDALFPRLDRYTQEHFLAEETLMSQYAYSHLDEHVAQHQQLIQHLDRVREDVAARRTGSIAQLESFLLDWLRNHINRNDRKYRGCFQWAENREILEKALFNEMISARQLLRIVDLAPPEVVLLDLRTETEYQEGIISGSRLYPCDHNLLDRQDTEPFRRCFEATFTPELFHPDHWYVLICRSGPRAAIALEIMQQHNLKGCELIGGIQEWTRQGLPMVTIDHPSLRRFLPAT